MRETDLYDPIKAFLIRQGYTVKAEVGSVDIVALRGDDPPLIVELKTGFFISIVHTRFHRRSQLPAGRNIRGVLRFLCIGTVHR